MLKILPQYLIVQLNKIKGAIFFIAPFFIFNVFASQDIPLGNTSPSAKIIPGLYSSFEEFIRINEIKYKNKVDQLKNEKSDLSDLSDANSLSFDEDFLNSIIFFTDENYLALGNKDQCSFYDLFLSNLLKSPHGPIENFLVNYKNKSNEEVTRWVPKEHFINKYISVVCPESLRFKEYFNKNNIQKTLSTINLKTPSSEPECFQIHETLIKDYKTPYLCEISNIISTIPELERSIKNTPTTQYQKLTLLKSNLKSSQFYKKILNQEAVSYLENLCSSLSTPDLFCSNFFNSSFWDKIVNGKKSQYYILNKCQQILKKKNLSPSDYKRCVSLIKKDPKICENLNNPYSLSPANDCSIQEELLNHSRQSLNYHDCPSLERNSAVTNIGRILNNSEANNQKTSQDCSPINAEKFTSFMTPFFENNKWPLSACYHNKISNTEVCSPIFYGHIEGSNYSVTNVIKNILYKTKGIDKKESCSLIKTKDYNPLLLKYQTGCYLLTSNYNCSFTNCDLDIILNQKKMDHIYFKKNLVFDYFPFNYMTEKYSFTKLLESEINRTHKEVRNISNIKFFLKNNPKAIFHGIGCRELLLPRFFKSNNIQSCTPLPFIVDGIKEENGDSSLMTYTAFDDLSSPRLISFSNIFQSIKAYQNIHPQKIWSFYVTY